MRPNSNKWNPSPNYLKGLFEKLRAFNETRSNVCLRIGVPYRTMSDYLNPKCTVQMPYTVQFAIECELKHMEETFAPVEKHLT